MKQLGELKAELGQLRIQKVVSSGSKLNKMYVYIIASLEPIILRNNKTP